MRVLITAGPTREHLDDVRFISNASSGRFGYALAAEAARRGHTVALLSGPVALAPPANVELIPVLSGGEMLQACQERFPACDAAVMCAAVCDYRPATRAAGKSPKIATPHTLTLEPTEDICATLGQMKHLQSSDRKGAVRPSSDRKGTVLPTSDRKGAEDRGNVTAPHEGEENPCAERGRILIGFALETDDARAHTRAEAKLRRKNCDAIVLNHPAAIGSDHTTIEVLIAGQGWSAPRSAPKPALAVYLIDTLEQLVGA
ncbi:MAG: phosphopantothenoylcysteine decarboxylase [bacterium]|nr:phosphopantothenoylcysteine decarboxylase [bacterium]